MKINRLLLDRLSCFMIITYPVFFRYKSAIPYITLGEVLLLAVIILNVLCDNCRVCFDRRKAKILVIFIIDIVLSIVVSAGNGRIGVDSIGTACRAILLYLFIIYLIPIFDFSLAKYYLDYIAIAVSVYAFLQIIAARKNIFLTSSLPLLNPIVDIDSAILAKAAAGVRFRPTSILSEPGELGAFLALPLALNLLDSYRRKGWLIKSVLFSVALISTMSATGIALLIIEWGLYLVKERNTYGKTLVVLLGIAFGAIVFFRFGLWRYFFDRVLSGGGISGLLSNTHFKDMPEILRTNQNLIASILGNGMTEPDGFLPGFFRLFYYMGLIGLSIYTALIIRVYRDGKVFQKNLLLIWIIMNLGSAYLLGCFALPYSLFIMCGEERKSAKKQVDFRQICASDC